MPHNQEQFSHKTAPLPGSVQPFYVRCGKARCGCMHGGALHGPYYRRQWREDGVTRRQYVRLDEAPAVTERCTEHRARHPSRRAVRRMVRQLSELSDLLLAQLAERQAAE
jgi:Family of unknown function (DUF6788)